MAVLGGLDALVFTAGIGEHSPYVRTHSLANMKSLGIRIDEKKNAKNEFDISTGSVKVLVVPTNEELAIARDTQEILESLQKEMEKPVSEEVISRELSQISSDDKAELLSLWLKNPHINVFELAEKLEKKIGKKTSIQVIKREMELLGLNAVSDKKKAELLQGEK